MSNSILIVCGALDGASGFFLSLVMSKAMNRSFGDILFGGAAAAGHAGATGAALRGASTADVAIVLTSARSVIVVPGYGMAAARCQHTLRELAPFWKRAARRSNTRFIQWPAACPAI